MERDAVTEAIPAVPSAGKMLHLGGSGPQWSRSQHGRYISGCACSGVANPRKRTFNLTNSSFNFSFKERPPRRFAALDTTARTKVQRVA